MRLQNQRDLLSVDPGVEGTGWAYFRNGIFKYAGTITPQGRDDQWVERMYSVANRFQSLVELYPGLDYVVMECPAFHGGVAGMVVASSGSLVKLSLLTGALLNICRAKGFTPTLTKPAEWKGQLPKDVTKKRCEEILKTKLDGTDHACDAIGIGLWALGKF